MNDDSGALPAETGLPGSAGDGSAEVLGQAMPGPRLPTRSEPGAFLPAGSGGEARRRILFVAWRDLANPVAGGSEVLVDQLASGMLAQGHLVTLLCGGPVAERPYHVMRNGGTYSQFLRAPLAYLRNFRNADLIVEVCNGMPFLAPLWSRRPLICLLSHVHTELWPIRVHGPVSIVGRRLENTVLPLAHRKNLFLTVSASTAESLELMGVGRDRIRQICNGVVQPDPPTPRSPDPLFVALGRPP